MLAIATSMALGTYLTFHQRGSTAAIGFIFTPIITLAPALVALVLGVNHGYYKLAKNNNKNAILYILFLLLCSTLLLGYFAWQIKSIYQNHIKIIASDHEDVRQHKAIDDNTRELAQLLAKNPGNELSILQQKYTGAKERTVLIPIANNKFTSPELLDQLSRDADFGVVLAVVRNKNTTSATLQWVYENASYPSYLFVDLAGNANTPEEILRELYNIRAENAGIGQSLADNLSVPDDIVGKLTGELDRYVLLNLLQRPHLACDQVNAVVISALTIKDAEVIRLGEEQLRNCI